MMPLEGELPHHSRHVSTSLPREDDGLWTLSVGIFSVRKAPVFGLRTLGVLLCDNARLPHAGHLARLNLHVRFPWRLYRSICAPLRGCRRSAVSSDPLSRGITTGAVPLSLGSTRVVLLV